MTVLGWPAISPGCLDTDITLSLTQLNALQMAAPRVAIWTHLATGHRRLRWHDACVPLPIFL